MGKSETHRTSEWPTNDPIYETTITHSNGHVDKGLGRTSEESQKIASEKSDSGGGGSSSSGGSSGGGGSSSCCYVTTACLDALGLPRDSLEMRAMKLLTKEHILKSFSGKRDYVWYGRNGPAIVRAIESRPDSKAIWKGVYEKLRDVTSSVLSKNYEGAHRLYKGLVFGLEEQFVKTR